MHSKIFTLLFILTSNFVVCQEIFNEEKVHDIRFTIEEDSYDAVLTSYHIDSAHLENTPHLPVSITIDGESLDSVGLRYKGKSSFSADMSKKSLKIDFNVFKKGQKFQGLRKMNLHNSFTDASFMRDPLSYHLFRKMGVHAPRTSYARVYINDVYSGLYQIVEQVDKSFVKGPLFKNMDWKSLDFKGSDSDGYLESIELKGKHSEKKWAEFAELLRIIEYKEGKELLDSLVKVFDIRTFATALVVYTATNNYDSVLKTGRNWYIAKPKNERYLWIPWDLNMSFSSVFPSQYENCNIFPNFFSMKTAKKQFQFFDESQYYTHVERKWDFGDGSFSTEMDPSHTYRRNGTYEVCLELSILDYCSLRKCEEINTRSEISECKTNSDTLNDYKFFKTTDRFEDCCHEWSDICVNYHKKITQRPTYSYGFFPEGTTSNLVKKLLAVKEFRKVYEEEMCKLLSDVFTEEAMNKYIDERITLIDEALRIDRNSLQPYEEFVLQTGVNSSKRNLRNIIKERIISLNGNKHCL